MSENKQQAEEEILGSFIYQNEDLEELESIIDQFNIFQSLGVVNQELRHSNFLAWLLDPSETHQLGDYFADALIKLICIEAKERGYLSPSIFDIDSWNFSDLEVRREWKNIDLFLVDHQNQFYLLIENKVRSGESDGQLKKYKEIALKEYPTYRGVCAFLTIEGYTPKDETLEYVPLSYKNISDLIDKLLNSKKAQIGEEILLFIEHYNELLKRYILEDSKIQEICRKIYLNHKKAIDLINQHKPDYLMDIKDVLVDLIAEENHLIPQPSNKPYIRFWPKQLDFIPKKAVGWLKDNRIVLFEFRNYESALYLCLIIGPGDPDLRNIIYNWMKENGGKSIYNRSHLALTSKYSSVHILTVVKKPAQFEFSNKEEIREILKPKFIELMAEVQKIADAMMPLEVELQKYGYEEF